MRCLRCKQHMELDLGTDSPSCSHCGSSRVRVNTVLFGENLSSKKFKAAQQSIKDAELVLVIGTSGAVYPARGLVDFALGLNKKTVLFDLEPWNDEERFDEVILGNCAVTLPTYL